MAGTFVDRRVLSAVPRSFAILVHDAAVEAARLGSREQVQLKGMRYWDYYQEALNLVRQNSLDCRLTEQAVFAEAARIVLQQEGWSGQVTAYCAYNKDGLKGLFVRTLGD